MYPTIVKVAIFAVDPFTSEGIGCLLRSSGGFEVVACLTHLASVQSLVNSSAVDCMIFTDDFLDEVSVSVLRRTTAERSITRVLLTSTELAADHDSIFDISVRRWLGVSALLSVLRELGQEAPSERRPQWSMPARPIVKRGRGRPRKEEAQAVLTVRLQETADLLLQGSSNRQIAEVLSVSEQCVKNYVHRLMLRFNCRNRAHLAVTLAEMRTTSAGR